MASSKNAAMLMYGNSSLISLYSYCKTLGTSYYWGYDSFPRFNIQTFYAAFY